MSKNGLDEENEMFEEMMEDDFYTELDDERSAELNEMLGVKVLGIELYDDSYGDDDEGEPVTPEQRIFFDCDLYLDDNQALELYVTTAYPDPDKDPVTGMDAIFEAVGRLADEQMELLDFGEADEEGGLALAFGQGDKPSMILVCSAWMVSDWTPGDDEDDEDEDKDEEDEL